MTLKVRGQSHRDNTQSLYNPSNAAIVLNLAIEIIDGAVVNAAQLTILTFYRAQYKLYRQGLRNLSLSRPEMSTIRVRTVDSMQGGEAPFIILDFVTTEQLGFMRLRNRVNVACSRPMEGLIIVGDVEGVMKGRAHERRYFGNVFNHVKRLRAEAKVPELESNEYLPSSLQRGDCVDQITETTTEQGNCTVGTPQLAPRSGCYSD